MARKKVVSRTIKTLEVKATVYNKESKLVEEITVEIPHTEKVEKSVKAKIETTHHLLEVVETVEHSNKYVMDEEKFVELAEIVNESETEESEGE